VNDNIATLMLYHYWDSTCSMKVRFCIEEKGISHQKTFVDLLAFDQLKPEYLSINPNAVVPTIVHNGNSIVESTVINEYLEEVFPEVPLLPEDPVMRAAVRALVRIEDGKMHDAFRAPTFNLMIKPMFENASDDEVERVAATHPQKWIGEYWKKTIKSPVDAAAVEASFNDLRVVMKKLDKVLDDGRPWLGGKDVSLAECSFVSLVDRTEYLGRSDLFDEFRALKEWRSRLQARASFCKAVPPANRRMFAPLKNSASK
jgi:glutathione S-transferase